jgi:ABC-type transport system involved in multi-copper enzyme maturation permease subunit
MKYLAILTDSMREALDSKVLYFTVGLSLLVILCMASISFAPQPADKGIEMIVQKFPGGGGGPFHGMPAPLRYEIENFNQLNPGSKPWDGAYTFDLKVKELGQEKGAFRLIVWALLLQEEDEAQLTAEDREARRRVALIAQQGQHLSEEQLKPFLTSRSREEIDRITPGQMERFVRSQLAAFGAFDASKVQLKAQGGGDYQFALEAKPKEGAFKIWPQSMALFFGAVPIIQDMPAGPLVFILEDQIVGGLGAGITMLISTIVTAFFIPNMLRKGTIDLLLVKPIRRTELLIYKFIGGLSFMLVNTVIAVGGIWLVLGLRSGLWPLGFLLTIPVMTFQFAIFYAVSALFGVLTRSVVVSILASCVLWALLFVFNLIYSFFEVTRPIQQYPQWTYTTVDTIHFLLPRYKDFDVLSGKVLARNLLPAESAELKAKDRIFASINWAESITVTIAFIAILLGLACWRFATKDY